MSGTRVLIPLLLLVAAGAAGTAAAAGDPIVEPLDREAVLSLARDRASDLRRARIEEEAAEGAVRSARTWRFNPELDLEAGRREGPEGRSWDRSLGLSQRLDLAGRGARIAAAEADLAAARQQSLATGVSVLGRAAELHLRALHAQARRRLAADGVDLHDRLLEIARQRLEAGETGQLDVHQATVAAARARMRLASSEAELQHALAELAAVLALDPGRDIAVAGEIEWPVPVDTDRVRKAAGHHPELLALESRLRARKSRIDEAGAARWPGLGLGARYGREEEADILRLGLRFDLPVFDRGQGDRAVARAVERIAALELETARRDRLDHALRAWERHRHLQRSFRAAADEAARSLTASGRLAIQSYRLGEIPLDRVLLVERDNLEARNELNDLRLTAALAALEVAEIAALPPLAGGEKENR